MERIAPSTSGAGAGADAPPVVDIVLPYRNAADTLDECLDSILAQTLRRFRLLAIDDHSDDGSAAIVRRHAARDPRIRCLDNGGHGLVDALNLGLERATTPLIARMDADDRMHPERLRLQYRRLLEQPQISLLGCATRPFPPQGLRRGLIEYIRWQNGCNDPRQIADEIYIESPFAHPGVMFRREPVQRLGGYRDGPFPEDYDLWLRLHHAGAVMAKLPQILLEWRDSPRRVSRRDPRCSREAFDRLRAHYLARDPRLLARRNHFVIWGAGRRTRKRCRWLLEQGFSPVAWIDIDPNKIGNRLNGVPVVAPRWLRRPRRPLVLIYVASHGARERIAAELEGMGYRRGADYLAVG